MMANKSEAKRKLRAELGNCSSHPGDCAPAQCLLSTSTGLRTFRVLALHTKGGCTPAGCLLFTPRGCTHAGCLLFTPRGLYTCRVPALHTQGIVHLQGACSSHSGDCTPAGWLSPHSGDCTPAGWLSPHSGRLCTVLDNYTCRELAYCTQGQLCTCKAQTGFRRKALKLPVESK